MPQFNALSMGLSIDVSEKTLGDDGCLTVPPLTATLLKLADSDAQAKQRKVSAEDRIDQLTREATRSAKEWHAEHSAHLKRERTLNMSKGFHR